MSQIHDRHNTKIKLSPYPLTLAVLLLSVVLSPSSYSAELSTSTGTQTLWWHGAFFGAITVLILVNLGQYGITREKSYSFYGLFLSTLSMSLASWLGYFSQTWLERNNPEHHSLTLFIYLTIMTYCQFCRSYFQLQVGHRLWNTAIHCLTLVAAMAAVLSYFLPAELSKTLIADVGILAATVLFVLSVVMVIENAPRAQTFMLTRLIITPPAMALAFSTFQFVPRSEHIYSLIMLALCVEAMVLTYSLVDHSVKMVQIRLQIHHEQSVKHVLQISQIKILRAMSREIRSPISGVIGMAQLLQDTSLTRNQKEQVQTIRRSGEALLKWLNRLSNWSAIRSKHVQLSTLPFDLPALVSECIDDHSDYAADRHIGLKLELDRRLPLLVNGDPERVKQILTGLLGHSLFYSEQGQITLTVAPGHSKHQLNFKLWDSHSGLQELEIEALQNDLDDSSHTSAQQDWYIAQQLSKAMQGNLSVHIDRYAAHSSAHYSLTLSLPRHTLLQHNEAEYDLLLRGKRLLIVDGNASSRKLLGKRADSWGMRVQEVPTATEAFEFLKSMPANTHCDIIVLDQEIPDLTGLELANQLHQISAIANHTTLIMLSGAAIIPEAEYAASKGIRRVLRKPITANSLKITLAEELTLAQGRRQTPRN